MGDTTKMGRADVELLERFIGEVDTGFDRLALTTREGWAIASTAVMAGCMLSDAWREDPTREAELRGGLRIAASIVSRMSESMSGRVTSNAVCMRELIDDPAAVIGRINARAAQLHTLGAYNDAVAVARLSSVLSPELTIALLDADGPAAARLRGLLDEAAPGAGFAVESEIEVNTPDKGDAAAEIGGKGASEMSEQNMTENGEKRYARIKVPAEQVALTSKVYETAKGMEMRGAFIHLPKGTVIDGQDLTGYEILERLADFQVDRVADGQDVTLRFDPNHPVSVFKGFADDGSRKDEVKVNAFALCTAIKNVYRAREENREKYCKISVPRSNVRPFERVDEATGEVVKKAAVKLPAGTTVDGQNLGGRTVFLYMSKFNEKDMDNQRDFIRFSIRRDAGVNVVADKGTDIADVRVSAEALSGAVEGAIQAAEREASDTKEGDYPGLSELEGVARMGSEMSAGGGVQDQVR